jgi:hypothetical protein
MSDEIINIKQTASCQEIDCTEYSKYITVEIPLDANLVCGKCGNKIQDKTVI